MNNFDFEHFASKLEETKTTKITKQSGVNYVLSVLLHRLGADEIDFSQFSFDDLIDAETELNRLITDEDTDGTVYFDPSNPFSVLYRLALKVCEMGYLKNPVRSPSPYLFI
ncbi:hypothetical protein V6C20_06820 [Caldibacillus thermoamylovorans]